MPWSDPNPIAQVVADFNQDGHADLIVTPAINLYAGDGTGAFALLQRASFTDASAVTTTDLNADGRFDLAVTQAVVSKTTTDLRCGSLPSVGLFTALPVAHTPPCIAAGDDPVAVRAADFDGDGRPDLAIVSGAAQGLRIFKGQAGGTFAQVITDQPGGSVAGSFISAAAMAPAIDLDGNGTPDLVVAHAGGVKVFLGNGDGTFAEGASIGSGKPTSALAIADLNADGRPDIASVEATDGRLVVDFALGGGAYSTEAIATIGPGLTDVAIADLDRDGRPDIVVAHEGGGTIRVFFGNGDHTFVANPPLALSVKPRLLAIRDWDEDGDLDLGIIDASVGGANAVLWIARQNRAAPNDATPPTVTLIPPTASGVVSGRVGVAAAAIDNVGVIRVEFYAGADLIGKSAGPDYLVSWNTATVPEGPVTLRARAIDASLNVSSWSAVQVFVQHPADTDGPVITLPADVTIEAAGSSGAVFSYSASAMDAVDGLRAVSCLPGSGATFPLGSTTVTCTAADEHGNQSTASFTVTVVDTTRPLLTMPADLTIQATSASGAVATYTASATDLVDGNVPVNCTPASGSTFPLGTTTVACTATDTHGNASSNTRRFTVVDTTPPSIAVPANATLEATSSSGTPFTFAAAATDLVDGSVAVSCVPASGSTFPIGSTAVNCSATDTRGNRGSASFTVTVRDTTSPVITAPANATIEATSVAGAAYSFTASATDVQDGAVAVTCVPSSGSIFALGTTPVACSAQDAHGNRASTSFSVTVVDTTAPAVTPPAAATVAATQADGARANITGSPASANLLAYLNGGSASDKADAAPVRLAAQAVIGANVTNVTSGTLFPVGTTAVTFRYRDARGNVGTATSAVTVTPPVGGVVGTANTPIQATNGENVVQPVTVSFAAVTQPGLLTAIDAMSNSPAPPPSGFRFVGSVLDISTTALVTPPIEVCITGSFVAGDRLLHFENGVWADATTSMTATRACGTVQSLSRFAVITAANHAPTVSAGAAQVVEATSPAGAAVTLTATATDPDAGDTLSYRWVEGTVELGTTASATVGFPIGVHTIALTVTDSQSATASASTSVTVRDTTAPVLTVPANHAVEATQSSGAVHSFTASAADIVDVTVPVTCTPASGSTFPFGPTTVNCGATDSHGNHAAKSFTVTVTDTTAPALTVPANATVEATGTGGVIYTFTASATDVLDGAVAPVCVPASGSTFAFGPTTVSCTATDAHGNRATKSFTVTVTDTTVPVVTVPANATVEATSAAGAVYAFTASALDSIDGPIAATCTPASGSTFPLGSTTTTCRATDAHGNTASKTFSVTVTDTTPPALHLPLEPRVEATSASGATYTYQATATDLVDGAVAVNCTRASGAVFPLGATAVTCTARDSHSNSDAQAFTVTVVDTTLPLVTVPAPATIEATGPSGAVYTFASSATDVVDGLLATVCTPASGSTFHVGATTVTCAATDAHGNKADAAFTVTVVDTTPAVVNVPANATVEATSAAGAVFTFSASATDSVDGSLAVTCTPASGSTFPLGATTVNCSATDSHQNSRSATFKVTVTDTTAPVVTVPANTHVEPTSPSGAPVTFSASAQDAVDGAVAVACTPPSGSNLPLGATPIACRATDAHGNTGTASFTVTVSDTAGPNVTVPADATVEATGPAGAAFAYTASASDVVDGALAVTCTPASGSTFPIGTTTVTCDAADLHGNHRSATFMVTVADTTAPTLALPADIVVETTDPAGRVVTYDATSNDAVDGHGNTALVQAGHLVYEGAFRVPNGMLRGPNLTEWQFDRATFEYGGTALAFNPARNSLFVVGHDQAQLVAEIAIPPVVNSADLNSLNTASLLQPFTDVTDHRLPLVNSDPLNPPDVTTKIGGLLPYGNQLFASAYIYYDGRSSQALSHFVSPMDLSTLGDATGPFTVNRADCDPATRQNCLGAGFFDGYFGRVPSAWQSAFGGPVINGNCCLGVIGRTSYGPALFTIDPARLGATDPLPAKPLVYYPPSHPLLPAGVEPCIDRNVCDPFIDGWNENSPLFNGVSEVRGVVFPEGTRTVLFFGRHGGFGTSPNVPGGGVFCYGFGTGDPALVGTFPPGELDHYCYDPEDGSKGVHGYPYRYYAWAYDAADLAAAAAGRKDPWTVRPYATWPLALPFAAGSTHLGGAAYDPATQRIYVSQYQGDANLPVIHVLRLQPALCQPPSGSFFPPGTTTVQCAASDRAGNMTTGSFNVTVTVADTTAPIVTVPADATIEATSVNGAPFTFSATATDNVAGPIAASCTPASGSVFPIGTTTVTCSATDADHNTGTASFTVTVADTAAPIVTVPANATVEATGPTGAPFTFTASAIDAVSGSLTPACVPASGSTFSIAATTVTCTATDARANTGSASFTVTVTDTTPPVLTVPANIVVDASGPSGSAVSYAVSAVDVVSGAVTPTCAPASGSTFPPGMTTVNCAASDARNNTRSASFTVTVVAISKPVVSLTAPANGATVSGASVTVSATASHPLGIAGVQFNVDGTTIGVEDTAAPYSVVWNTGTTPNGTHTLTAIARDVSGSTNMASISVTVNNAPGAVDLAVDGSQKFQTISGFMVNANSAQWNDGQLAPALDMLIDQGVAVFRVIIDKQDWETTNDNADANVFNWTFYNAVYTSAKFEKLWSTIGYLNQKGISSGILLNFMGPGPAWMGAPRVTAGLEDEWVETIASLVYYAKVTRGLQFSLLGPANEVDWDGIEGPQIEPGQYGLALRKLAIKLDSLGLNDTRLVGPDTAQAVVAVNDYFSVLKADPVVMDKLAHLGFHNYGDSSANADAVIKASTYPTKDFWVTEAAMGSDYYGPDHLIAQIKNGATSAGVWDAYTSVYNHRANDGAPMIDLVGSTWVPKQSFFSFKQLFKFAQPGAVRIGTSGSAANLISIAFYNPSSGQVTIVGHNTTGGRNLRISLANVPAVGALQFYVTDNFSHEFERRADVTLVNGVATIAVDLDEFFTLTASTGPDTTAPTISMLTPANGATVLGTGAIVSATVSDNISIAGVQFKLDGANLGPELTTAPYSMAWNTTAVANGPHALSAVARDGSGNAATATAISVTVNNPVDVAPPTVSISVPANGATVSGSNVAITATATDDVGVVGVQFFLDGVAFGSEVTAPPFTTSWDTTLGALGAHTLSARARDGAGRQTTSASITVTVVAPPPPTLAIDATAFGDRGTPATTVTSSAFSTTTANQLLVAFIAADDAAPSPRNTVTGVAGGGLTWTLVVRTNVQRGTAEIWRAVAATALSGVTVTATLAQSSASSITVASFIGADTTGTNGSNGIGATLSASGATGAQTGTVTTTRANSWVWGVGVDWDSAVARTIGSGQTKVHEFLAPVNDTYWVQRRTAVTPTAGSAVTINTTAPTTDQWNLSICEIRARP